MAMAQKNEYDVMREVIQDINGFQVMARNTDPKRSIMDFLDRQVKRFKEAYDRAPAAEAIGDLTKDEYKAIFFGTAVFKCLERNDPDFKEQVRIGLAADTKAKAYPDKKSEEFI